MGVTPNPYLDSWLASLDRAPMPGNTLCLSKRAYIELYRHGYDGPLTDEELERQASEEFERLTSEPYIAAEIQQIALDAAPREREFRSEMEKRLGKLCYAEQLKLGR